jgi:putative transposase
VSRKRMSRLMAKLGLVAVYPRPKTAKSHSPHHRYPYLAAGFSTCGDHGLALAPRAVFPAVEHGFRPTCVAALPAAIERFGVPEIFNTDQGCQFGSAEFTGVLALHGIRISMDGRGRWIDNVFIERLWRSLKYECVYLEAFESPRDARTKIDYWIKYYKHQRPHSSLEKRTPHEAYQGIKPVALAA